MFVTIHAYSALPLIHTSFALWHTKKVVTKNIVMGMERLKVVFFFGCIKEMTIFAAVMDETINNRVTLFPDGKYRWVYEVKMLTNPTILFDVYKVLGISFGFVWLFNLLIIGCEGDLTLSSIWASSYGFLILMAVFVVIGYVAYVIVAWVYGWKYVVLFTLNEKEVVHQQIPRQVKKAQVLGALTAMVGGLAGKPGVVGTGLLTASKSSSTSKLADVAHLIPNRRRNLIKVNQLFNRNRIYVPDEDFDFVYDFLRKHCTKA